MCRGAGSCAAAGAGRPAAAVSCRVAVHCRQLPLAVGPALRCGCAESHLLRFLSTATLKHPSPGPTSTQGPRRRSAASAAAGAAWRDCCPLRAAAAAVCARPHHWLHPLAAGASLRRGRAAGCAPGCWRGSLPAPPSQDSSIVSCWTDKHALAPCTHLRATGSLPPALLPCRCAASWGWVLARCPPCLM